MKMISVYPNTHLKQYSIKNLLKYVYITFYYIQYDKILGWKSIRSFRR